MITPTVFFYGEHDTLANVTDVLALEKLVPSLVHGGEEIPDWNHADFVFGVNAAKLLYTKIVKMIKEVP